MDVTWEDRVRERAHAIWQREGRPEGGAEQYWAQAEEELRGAPQVQPATASPQPGAALGNGPAPQVQPATASPQPGAALENGPAPQDRGVEPRRVEYLVSIRPSATLSPAARTSSVLEALRAMPDLEIIDTIRPPGSTLFSSGTGAAGDVIVTRTTQERGLALQMSAATTPDVVVEENLPLIHLQLGGVPPGLLVPAPTRTNVQLRVVGDNGQPLERATVVLYGEGFPVQGETNAQGAVTLAIPGTIDRVQALYVKPFANFWERFIGRPALNDAGVNTVSVQPLSAFRAAAFPGNPFIGWGQRLMGLDQQFANTLTGRGVRIAIVDSGCDNRHPALTHIQIGRDYTQMDPGGNPNQQSWNVDVISHGTHVAGVIAGNGRNSIRGFAPEAEVHILKLFPGGAFDSLIRALRYAIDNQIDVINCSLGSDQSSELVQRWMEQARQAGVAVIVAVGNSAGQVQFPARLPGVLAVSAIGHQGDFPNDTYHAQTVVPNLIGVNGLFAPRFTCFGPEVRICGPGVAIISSVPGGGYAAWDGTSMASPHLAGITALVAAHNPAISAVPRNADRVDRLFQTVMAAASSIGLNPNYTGAGLPSVSSAVQSAAVPQQAVGTNLEDIVRQAVAAALAGALPR